MVLWLGIIPLADPFFRVTIERNLVSGGTDNPLACQTVQVQMLALQSSCLGKPAAQPLETLGKLHVPLAWEMEPISHGKLSVAKASPDERRRKLPTASSLSKQPSVSCQGHIWIPPMVFSWLNHYSWIGLNGNKTNVWA